MILRLSLRVCDGSRSQTPFVLYPGQARGRILSKSSQWLGARRKDHGKPSRDGLPTVGSTPKRTVFTWL